jgi:hypothetical protein
MVDELDVLRLVSETLDRTGTSYMLTGSFAMAHYAVPRMTRDLDLVVRFDAAHVDMLVRALASEFYLDEGAAREAVASERLFNLMHLRSGIKVDLIVCKSSEYRRVEFDRRRRVRFADFDTWIVSLEDLILSKLVWAKESGSELQRRDVRSLLALPVDEAYLDHWSRRLTVHEELRTMRA